MNNSRSNPHQMQIRVSMAVARNMALKHNEVKGNSCLQPTVSMVVGRDMALKQNQKVLPTLAKPLKSINTQKEVSKILQ